MAKRAKQNSNTDGYGIYCTEIVTQLNSSASPLSLHSHTRIELIYAISINTDIVIDSTPFRFQTGDIAVITPNTPHSEHISGNGRYLSIKIPAELLFSSRRDTAEYISFSKFTLVSLEKCFFTREQTANIGLNNTILEIIDEWECKNEGYEQMIRALVLKILTQLSRIQSEQDKNMQSFAKDSISRVISYISDNFATVTEQSAAEYCGLTVQYFSALFKRSVGMRFSDYLTKSRLDRAKKLLITTDKSMTYIAFETGFSSSSHFISKFKEAEGITPSKYRTQMRQGKINTSVQTPQFIVRFKNVGQPSGHFLIFKYRTNRREDMTWLPLFVESNASCATGKGLTWAVIEADESWHVIIIDMTMTKQLTEAFKPDNEGNFHAGHIWIHPFYKTFRPGFYFDLSYVAFTDSLEHALGIIDSREDIFFGYFSTENGEEWVKCDIDNNTIPIKKETDFYSSGEYLLSSIVATGISLRKIELLNEAGTDFTRVWCV